MKHYFFVSILTLCSLDMSAQMEYRGFIQVSNTNDTYYKDVVLGDINNDCFLDIYLPQKHPGDNYTNKPTIDHIFLNGGNGFSGGVTNLDNDFVFVPTATAFPSVSQILTNRGYDAELIDLDGDGFLDIIRPDRITIYVIWGNGNGSFGQISQVNLNIDPNSTANFESNYDDADFADLDGDGDIDFIIAAYASSGENLIFRNDGNRNFTLMNLTLGNQLPADGTHSVSIGDYNNDGFMDVLLANKKPKLYKGSATPFKYTSVNVSNMPKANGGTPIADFVDLNQDGFLDIYVGNREGEQNIFFHSGDNNNPYPNAKKLAKRKYFIYDARYANVTDANGQIQILTVSCCGSANTMFQSFTISKGANPTVSSNNASTLFNNEMHGNIGIALGDLDNDGDLDMVTGGSENGMSAVHIYENKSINGGNKLLENITVSVGANVQEKAYKNLTAQNYYVPIGATANFTAGKSIHLKNGFHAQGNFHAYIDPLCPPQIARKMENSNNELTEEENENISQKNSFSNPKLTTKKESSPLGRLGGVLIYPNPSRGIFVVELGEGAYTQIQIIDFLGRQVYSRQILGNRMEIDISQFNAGIYNVLLLGEGVVSNHKVVVE